MSGLDDPWVDLVSLLDAVGVVSFSGNCLPTSSLCEELPSSSFFLRLEVSPLLSTLFPYTTLFRSKLLPLSLVQIEQDSNDMSHDSHYS